MSLKKFLSGFAIAAMVAVPMVSSASQPSNNGMEPEDPIIKITHITVKADSIDKKFKECIAHAEKHEQPAPPVDPSAHCRGKVHVVARATAMARCPDGSAKASAYARVGQWVTVRADSQAVASGHAEAHVHTIIKDQVRAKAKASVKCFKKKTPQPTPPHDDGDCNDCDDGGDNTTIHRTRNVTVVQGESFASEKGVEELPNTGPETAVFGAFGSGAMGVGIRSFIRSRKGLASALLGK